MSGSLRTYKCKDDIGFFFMNQVFFVFIGLCKQPYSEEKPLHLVIMTFRTTQGLKPPSGEVIQESYNFVEFNPKNPTCGLMFWVQKVNSNILIFILSLRVKTS
jgi:hypothetical protein